MWKYKKKNDGTILLKEYLGEEEVLVIPAVYEEYKVSEVGDSWMPIFYSAKCKKIVIEEEIQFVNDILPRNHSVEEVQLPKSLQGLGDSTCEKIAKLGFADLEFFPKYRSRCAQRSLGCVGNIKKRRGCVC